MKESLQPGLATSFSFVVPEDKTVPYLYPEAPEFQPMPRVFATGYLVGLAEWACMKLLTPHLDWPREQSVGIDVKLSHTAATPPGLTVTVDVRLERVEGRKLLFSVTASDGVERISEGTHERYVIDTERFNAKAARKLHPRPLA
jgi:fluoroacetyl-CoA thioesterase